jgi:ribose-phosphate pyrophosphokinase
LAHTRAPLRLLACEGARGLAQGVAEHLDVSLLQVEEIWFACGEGKAVIKNNVRGCDVYVMQQPIVPGSERSVYDRFIMLLHVVEAAALADAEHITAVLPYFPGARQDKRKSRTREGISAGLFARMLEEAGACRVISVEIHNEAIGGMFHPRHCVLENVYLTKHLARFIRKEGLCGEMVVSPDLGGLERARRFAEELGLGLAALSKERDYSKANTVMSSTLIGDVRGHDVMLVDDMVDTAGSVVASIEELKHHGAAHITVACAHPVLSGPAWDRLEGLYARSQAEGWRFRFVGSSSVQHTDTPPWYREFPLEPLLAKVLRNVNARGSVTRAQES